MQRFGFGAIPKSVWRMVLLSLILQVAVIGIFAARTTASGITAAGTRSATFPVFAVTFSGKCEAAGTIMVSGPGQNRRASK